MTRYENKLKEISSARNSSKTSSKVREIKWTNNQLLTMRKIAALPNAPDLNVVKNFYPKMSEYKISRMLKKIKEFRKSMAEIVGYEEHIDGIQSSEKSGIIYLVEHELYKGWIKCGMTVNIKTRIGSYNCNDPLKRFKVIVEKNVSNRRKSESLLKYNLKMTSSLSNGEWYRIDKDEALRIFNNIY